MSTKLVLSPVRLFSANKKLTNALDDFRIARDPLAGRSLVCSHAFAGFWQSVGFKVPIFFREVVMVFALIKLCPNQRYTFRLKCLLIRLVAEQD